MEVNKNTKNEKFPDEISEPGLNIENDKIPEDPSFVMNDKDKEDFDDDIMMYMIGI